MNHEKLKQRTKEFALRVIRLVEELPTTIVGKTIANQIIRSGTSVAANYRAACRARSKEEFVAKLGTVIEEADETLLFIFLSSPPSTSLSYSCLAHRLRLHLEYYPQGSNRDIL